MAPGGAALPGLGRPLIVAAQAAALLTQRSELVGRLAQPHHYDLAVVGGGATGLGIALDAAARGFSVVLVESHDFAKGSSSRATKLVHGGVRYLAQGNIGLVREALHERTLLLHNAPHLAQPLAFVMPSYRWWEMPFYGLGLAAYDLLAGRAGLGKTEFLGPRETLGLLPNAQRRGLLGGVKYWDGQFDDARLALALARSAALQGALLLNYCCARDLLFERGRVSGLRCEDMETGAVLGIRARCVVNATGVWVDALRQRDGEVNPRDGRAPTQRLVVPSQGVHLVVDRRFLPGAAALMVPRTADGRVLFAVPWLGKLILGTTDTPRNDLVREPRATRDEVDFILGEAARYLERAPQRSDVRSVWVGLRPLVKPHRDDGDTTKGLSREHRVLVSRSGLVSVTGGKWTTYRAMAEDVLEQCFAKALLPSREKGVTAHISLVGAVSQEQPRPSMADAPGLHSYGGEQALVMALPGAGNWLTPGLSEAMVRFAVRHEYARCVEDVLARRSRLLFLDARLAHTVGARTGDIIREETGRDPGTDAFLALADAYSELPD